MLLDPADAKRIATLLSAVGEPTRMHILRHLVDGPAHVGGLAEAVGVPMVNMSHHLGVMRQAGLLDCARDGRRMIYSLHPAVVAPAVPADGVAAFRFGPLTLVLLKMAADGKARKRPR